MMEKAHTDAVKDIFERLKSGEYIYFHDPEYHRISQVVNNTRELVQKMNLVVDTSRAWEYLSEITGSTIDPSVTLFTPFYTNFGIFTVIGKRVFINHGCSFLDMGGIRIDDEVLIGPQVKLITENHPLEPGARRAMTCKPIHIKRNAWIGAGATILPGVTVGENSVIAAGAVVAKEVPDNVVVAGIPAKIIKTIDSK